MCILHDDAVADDGAFLDDYITEKDTVLDRSLYRAAVSNEAVLYITSDTVAYRRRVMDFCVYGLAPEEL